MHLVFTWPGLNRIRSVPSIFGHADVPAILHVLVVTHTLHEQYTVIYPVTMGTFFICPEFTIN